MKWKTFFIIFKGFSIVRNCLRPEKLTFKFQFYYLYGSYHFEWRDIYATLICFTNYMQIKLLIKKAVSSLISSQRKVQWLNWRYTRLLKIRLRTLHEHIYQNYQIYGNLPMISNVVKARRNRFQFFWAKINLSTTHVLRSTVL